MANQIQATIYQIDGNPQVAPISVSFLTSDIMMYDATLITIPAVQTAIVYYPSTSNQLQTQVFYASEGLTSLLSSANSGLASQITSPVLEINGNPLPSPINYSFPANGVSIWEKVSTYVLFKNKTYTTQYNEATLVAQANAGGGGGGTSTGVNGLNGTTNIGLGGTLNNNTTIDANVKDFYWNNGSEFNVGCLSCEFTSNTSKPFLSSDGNSTMVGITDGSGNGVSFYYDYINSTIKSYYNNSNTGIFLDFVHDIYKFGSLLPILNQIQFIVDNTNQIIKTTQNNNNDGLYIEPLMVKYYLGYETVNEIKGFHTYGGNAFIMGHLDYIHNVNNAIVKSTGNFYASDGGYQNNCEISYADNNTQVSFFLRSNRIGFEMIYNTNEWTYYFTQNQNPNGLYFISNQFGAYYQIGDFQGTNNGTWMSINDTDQTLEFTPNLLVGSSGSSSGQHLKVRIGVNDYVIELKNP